MIIILFIFFFSSRRRHTRWTGDWSSDVCSSDLMARAEARQRRLRQVTDLLTAATRFRGEVVRGVEYGDAARHRLDVYAPRSEERRVGKECRSRGSPDH